MIDSVDGMVGLVNVRLVGHTRANFVPRITIRRCTKAPAKRKGPYNSHCMPYRNLQRHLLNDREDWPEKDAHIVT
jgi:hypothetical protein